jgi:ribonucleoside-diphosphate reductase alpha chain
MTMTSSDLIRSIGNSTTIRQRVMEALVADGLMDPQRGPKPRLTSNAEVVLQRRYLAKDREGKSVEVVDEMFRRVAQNLAQADRNYEASDAEVSASEDKFYAAMKGLEFLPNSPTLMNAGRELQQLSACFVLPVKDSLDSIFEMVKATALIHKSGGGTGFAFSQLRPSGDVVGSTGGIASGPVSFIRAFDTATDVVKQGGTRRGANMGILHVTHPDIMKFIRSKEDGQNLSNFNISVAVNEEFMEKAERGEEYDLINPRTGVVSDRLNAREVFDELVQMAWTTGDPGIIFLDRINRDNPNPQLGDIESTNPCGEQPLLPFESCNLGSLNLALMLKASPEGAAIDWERLERTVNTAVHMLDNVVDMNHYPLPEIDEMSKKTRRIGLGVMGFADMLLQMGIPYASEEALGVAEEVMGFIYEKTQDASAALSERRGCFPAWEGSVYNHNGSAQPMRNSAPTTIAPTGTISIIAGCSSGIEPLFALSYVRNVMDNDRLVEGNPFFEAVIKHEGFYSSDLMEQLAQTGSLHQMGHSVPEWVSDLFITSHDVTPEWHVRMQAAFQRHTDNAVSKTINFPGEATKEDVENSYMLAFREGCKGITIYRDGSKDNQVLSPGQGQQSAIQATTAEPQTLMPRPRPQEMVGITERVRTGHGNMYITINFDTEGSPFEVFSTLGKAGGCDSAQLEAISRLVSLSLRSGIDPEAVMEQLRGITCCPAWDRGVLVRSAPDAVALSLEHALSNGPPREAVQLKLAGARDVDAAWAGTLGSHSNGNGASTHGVSTEGTSAHGNSPNERNRCPDCNGTLAFQEGCLLCSSCGWNRCGS